MKHWIQVGNACRAGDSRQHAAPPHPLCSSQDHLESEHCPATGHPESGTPMSPVSICAFPPQTLQQMCPANYKPRAPRLSKAWHCLPSARTSASSSVPFSEAQFLLPSCQGQTHLPQGLCTCCCLYQSKPIPILLQVFITQNPNPRGLHDSSFCPSSPFMSGYQPAHPATSHLPGKGE